MKQSDSLGRLLLESMDQHSNTSAYSRKQFSFHRTDAESTIRSTLRLRQIEHVLGQLTSQRLSDLLIQQIQYNEQMRANLLRAENSYEGAREEINILAENLALKKESYLLLSDSQAKNEQKISDLEDQLKSFKKKYSLKSWIEKKEYEWQKKYQQLARHMDIYVENTREVQEEFTRKREGMKKQIANAYKNNSQLNLAIKELTITNISLMEQVKNSKLQLNEAKNIIEQLKNQKIINDNAFLGIQMDISEVKRLQAELRDAKQMAEVVKSRCKELEDDCRSSHLQIDSLKSQLSCLESSKQKQVQDLSKTTDRHVHELKADRDRLQLELDCLKMQVGANEPHKAIIDELKLQNISLKGQIDQAYRMVAQLKADMVLLQGQADRLRRQLKRQTEKNNQIKTQLDRFCKRRRETPSPECVLSEIQQNLGSSNPRKSPLSNKKIQQFIVDSKDRLFNPKSQSACKQNIGPASCIIGEESHEE